MHLDEHQDWLDGFDTWEEVWSCLQDDWARVVDVTQRLELERDLDALLVVEIDHRLRARQRRDLHRLGFRPVTALRSTVWQWDIAEAVRSANPADFPHPLLSRYESVDRAARPRSCERLRTQVITEGLVSQQVRRVIHDVFGSTPADLAVVTDLEPDLWDDDEEEDDEGWQLPTG